MMTRIWLIDETIVNKLAQMKRVFHPKSLILLMDSLSSNFKATSTASFNATLLWCGVLHNRDCIVACYEPPGIMINLLIITCISQSLLEFIVQSATQTHKIHECSQIFWRYLSQFMYRLHSYKRQKILSITKPRHFYFMMVVFMSKS